jgi:surface antigen
LGAGAGALIGGAIGQNLDEQDKRLMETSSQKALEAGQTGSSTAWRNPDSGHSGSITPVKTYQNDRGEYCREYTQIVEIGGKSEKAYGKACRKPDGNWEIVK